MQEYNAQWETEYGMDFDTIIAKDRREFTKLIKAKYPEDHGADGCYYDIDGNEFPINW